MLEPIERPQFVYKYSSASRVAQILRDLTFFFAPAKDQNDLFEFRARSFYTADAKSKYRMYAKRLIFDGAFSSMEEAIAFAEDPGMGMDDERQLFLSANDN
jgi:hypothetical protein